jgi:peptide/nickel transport system substrate-binding protein
LHPEGAKPQQEDGMKRAFLAAAMRAAAAALAPASAQQNVLKVVLPGELRSIDSDWTAAAITRYHSFMVYDTLLGLDANQQVQPQMADRYELSDDKLTYTFHLRDKLAFSDGTPVTAEDVVASWIRWAEADGAGQMIATFLAGLDAVDARTVRVRLKEPFPQLPYVLAKPMAIPMFVKPARIVKGLSARTQFSDPLGSGPFIMRKDEWVAGSKTVYVRNPGYVPRAEPASGIAGGKVARVERVEWVVIPDPSTQASALRNGEVDFVESPTLDLIPMLRTSRGVVVEERWPTGSQGTLRVNWTNPPFDNPIARRAMYSFVNQRDMILAALGDEKLGQVCGALLICGSPNGSEYGAETLIANEPEDVRLRRGMEMLRAGGYKGEKIVVLDPSDQPIMNRATQVLVAAMRKAGVNVEMQTMDWATVVSRRAVRGPAANGWHIFLTMGGPLGPANPVFHVQMSAACDRGWFGWPCDPELERLRAAWIRETDPIRARWLVENIQLRGAQIVVYVPFGQYASLSAQRDNLEGLLKVPETVVFWNVAKR